MESFIPTARLMSYTRGQKDQTCRRAGYLSREWGGTGLVPITSSWDLVFGNLIHKYLNLLAVNGHIDFADVRQVVLTEATKAFSDVIHARAWATLAEGLLRIFCSDVWPLWMKEYEVYQPEAWIEYEIEPGFKYRARRDLLLVSRFDGHLSYREYKTTSTTRPEFFKAFDKDVQLHTGMLLEKLANGRDIRDGVMQSFYKGYKDKKNHTQRSVFSQGYVNRQFPLSPEYEVEYTRKKGWESFSTFEEFPDLTVWLNYIKNKAPQLLSEQLGRTGPIFPREDIVRKYFKQQIHRAKEIQEGVELLQKALTVEAVEDILDRYWPQTFEECEPKYGGFNCEFRDCCWIPHIGADPLGSGLFERYDATKTEAIEIEDAQI